jgi:ferritin-like protein
MANSVGYHESLEVLKPETLDRHRALASIMEELEAVDWYDQRVDAAQDAELRAILAHNRDEEKEHASMVLEWLRRRDARFDEQLRNYLFTDKPILEQEHEIDERETRASQGGESDGSLGIGSLREERPR